MKYFESKLRFHFPKRETKLIKVVIADDQPLMRSGFRMILEAQDDIMVVAEAGDGATAVSLCETYHPDVALMDIRMPILDGLKATQQINDTKVLILTTFNLDEYVIGALRAGASGFLLKDATPQELVRSVRAVAAGDAALAPEITRLVLEMVRVPQQDEAIANRAIEGLSAREMEVLKLLAQGMSNSEVAERLFVSETTVKSHVSHLLAKLGLRDRVQAVVMAYELGIIRPGEK